MKKKDELTFLGARRDIYYFLMHMYLKEIDKKRAQVFLDDRVLMKFNEEGYNFDIGFFQDFTQKNEDALASAYALIFLGPGDHLPPYESVHNPHDSQKGRLWGNSTVAVKRCIEESGLSFNGHCYHGIPDHISIEFEFMGKLIDAQMKAITAKDTIKIKKAFETQRDFFKEHMYLWIKEYAAKIISYTTNNFYREIAKLTHNYIESEELLYVSS